MTLELPYYAVATDGTVPIFMAGPLASRPAPGQPNRLYLVTDAATPYLARDSGAAWSTVGSSEEAASILQKLLTVDTDGSGLNANFLQGKTAGEFLLRAGGTMTGPLEVLGNITRRETSTEQYSSTSFVMIHEAVAAANRKFFFAMEKGLAGVGGPATFFLRHEKSGSPYTFRDLLRYDTADEVLRLSGSEVHANGSKVLVATDKGATNGVAPLSDGVVPEQYIPAVAGNASESADVSHAQPGTGGVIRTLQQILSEGPVNVRGFGFTGAGTDTDRARLQSALDYIQAAGGGELYIPPGLYWLNSFVSMRDNVTIRGAGRGATILRNIVDAYSGMFREPVDSQGLYTLGLRNVAFRDITLDGNAQSRTLQSDSARTLILSWNVVGIALVNIDLTNAWTYGLGLQGRSDNEPPQTRGPATDIHLENVRVTNCGYGAVTELHDGIDIKGSRRLKVIGCYFAGNGDKGLDVRGEHVSVVGCVSENNLGHGFTGSVEHGGLTTYGEFVGCHAIGNSQDGFNLTAPSDYKAGTGFANWSFSGSTARGNLNGLGVRDPGPGATQQVRLRAQALSLMGNSQDGVHLGAKLKAAIISNCSIVGNGGDGVQGINQDALEISGNDIESNSGYGVRTSGASDYAVVEGNRFRLNTLGSHSLTGRENVVENNRPRSANIPYSTRLTHHTGQSTPNATTTPLAFSIATYDFPGLWASAQNTGLTVREAGRYRITFQGQWASSATGERWFWAIAGTRTLASSRVNANASNVTDHGFSTEVDLSAGDFLQVNARQTSGGSLNVSAPAAGGSPVLTLTRLE